MHHDYFRDCCKIDFYLKNPTPIVTPAQGAIKSLHIKDNKLLICGFLTSKERHFSFCNSLCFIDSDYTDLRIYKMNSQNQDLILFKTDNLCIQVTVKVEKESLWLNLN